MRRRLTGIVGPLGSGGISWSTVESHVVDAGLRSQIELLTDLLTEHETGLLVTLDEIHRHQIGELRELAVVVQHAFREDRDLAFVGAGLASAISDVVNDKVLTFLRRAERHHLGSVGPRDVERALRDPIEASGRRVSDEALGVMVEGTGGYPFLIQLVGSQSWRVRPSSADIRRRLGVDENYASQYRRRLIAAELIEPTLHGYVDFALPYLREYLREHAASDV